MYNHLIQCQMKKMLLLLCVFLSGLQVLAQPINIDSLWNVWQDETRPDTSRLQAIDYIAWDGYLYTKPDSAFYFAQMQYDLAEKKGLKRYMAMALSTQGVSFAVRGAYPQALDYIQRNIKINEEMGNRNGVANSLNSIGNIYKSQGDYPQALDYNQRSLKIYEEIGDKSGIAHCLISMG